MDNNSMAANELPPWGIDLYQFTSETHCIEPTFTVISDDPSELGADQPFGPLRELTVSGYSSISVRHLVANAIKTNAYVRLGWAPLTLTVSLGGQGCRASRAAEAETLDKRDDQITSNMRSLFIDLAILHPKHASTIHAIAKCLFLSNADYKPTDADDVDVVRFEPLGDAIVVIISSYADDNLIGLECLTRLIRIPNVREITIGDIPDSTSIFMQVSCLIYFFF